MRKASGRFLPDTPLATSAAAVLVGDKGGRLSVQKCRELLGVECDSKGDKEIELLRDQCYQLADILISEFIRVRDGEAQPHMASQNVEVA